MKTTDRFRQLPQFPPLTILGLALVVGLSVVGGVIGLALTQPWLGLRLIRDSSQGVVVERAEGPGEAIPEGIHLVAIGNGEEMMYLEPLDLAVEPDGAMGDYKTYRRFLERQEQLARIQSSHVVHLSTAEGQQYEIHRNQERRPPGTLPIDFWVQVAVGFVAWLVSASVFAVRPREISARYLLLSGGATLMFASLAAVYSTRELALAGSIFRWLNDLNFLGGSLFAGSFVALLFHYPRRIAPVGAGILVVLLYVGWWVAQQVGAFESMTFARRFLVMAGVVLTFGLAGVHWFQTRKDPVARAALQWFLLSWMAGTVLFALFILLPQMFGVDTSPVQGYSFLLFLLVYGGLAFGICRFRLFELGDWWRRILVWTLSVFLLVLLDLFFVMQLHLSTELSLSLALLACGIFWLPLRAFVWGRFVDHRKLRPEDLFGQVVGVALAPHGDANQAQRWRELLCRVFNPLSIEEENLPVEKISVARDGLVLRVPGVGGIPPFRLECADGGRRLFSTLDLNLLRELTTMLGHAITSKAAYETGVAEERRRITRDMHDHIGGQLLAALHRRDPEGKDATIRETLAEFRQILNDTSGSGGNLEEMLAELRVETADRLAGAGLLLNWKCEAIEIPKLDLKVLHALRAITREAVTNIIKHSAAARVWIIFGSSEQHVSLRISDDGEGFDPEENPGGHGLHNMRGRLEEVGGHFRWLTREVGSALEIVIPHRAELVPNKHNETGIDR